MIPNNTGSHHAAFTVSELRVALTDPSALPSLLLRFLQWVAVPPRLRRVCVDDRTYETRKAQIDFRKPQMVAYLDAVTFAANKSGLA